ncbi:MAG TPA: tetratricopeptide repeat protein [Gemmatimonadales bacterium]|nr:tetratricopeptide repeat protein [Gemmatimonadales bacterium]
MSEPSTPSTTGAGAGADKRASAGIETFDGSLNFDAVAHEAAKADGLEVEEEVELTPQDLVVEGLAPTQFESIAPSPDTARAAPAKAGEHLGAPAHEELLELLAPDADSGPTVDLPLIMPDDEETVAAAPPAPPPPSPAPRRTAASTPPRPSPPPPPLPAPPPPAAVALSDDDGAADTEMLSRAEPVVTETMAELYLRQGHADDALRVYQALLAQRPGDARLQARVARLTGGGGSTATGALGGGSGESVETFLRRILAGRPRPEGAEALLESPRIEDHPASPEPEAEPLGSALDGAFGIAPMEAEPRPDVEAPGEATRPAADTISLDAVFGDEARSSLPTLPRAVPPASETLASAEEPPLPPPPSEAPASSASGLSSTGGFSFDQFFGPSVARGEGGAPAGESTSGGGGASPQRTSGAKPRVPAEDEADLDQFQAWLRGLKS